MNKNLKKIKEYIKENTFLFIIIKNITAHTIYFINRVTNYQLEKIRFYKILGYRLNLQNPRSYNEKIIWKKIYDRNPLLPLTADKYLARTYIKDVLGEEKAREILIPLLYVTDKPETIPFEKLKIPYIIKPNHASGLRIIVENKQYDKNKIIKTCKKWLQTPYGLEKLEWAYQPVKRKIIIEKLLREDDSSIPKDFKFQMYHGKCRIVAVVFNRMCNPTKSYFDEKLNLLPVRKMAFPQGPKIKKPINYKKMLELAEILSKDFDYIRVDFYNLNGKIYFGELTHYTASGIEIYIPKKYDFEFGKYWEIKPKYWEKYSQDLFS